MLLRCIDRYEKNDLQGLFMTRSDLDLRSDFEIGRLRTERNISIRLVKPNTTAAVIFLCL